MSQETQEMTVYGDGDIQVKRPPELVLEEAMQAAEALAKVLAGKKRKIIMNGEQYLEFEDWQTVGRFYGVTAKVKETAFIDYGGVQGFEAKAVAIRADGMEISAAEAMCLNDEENWRARSKYEYLYVWKNGSKTKEDPPKDQIVWVDNPGKPGKKMPQKERILVGEEPVPLFQLKSMAQTRACAKALRNVLAWVVVLAGYKATPSEEMLIDNSGENKLAWIAGFIDGEGSLGLNKEFDPRKGENYFHYRPALQIVNTDKEAVEAVYRFVGEGDFRSIDRYKEEGKPYQEVHRFVLRKQQPLLQLLRQLLPYLIVKKRRAELLIEYIEGRKNAEGRGWFKPATPKDSEIFEQLKQLNLRGLEARRAGEETIPELEPPTSAEELNGQTHEEPQKPPLREPRKKASPTDQPEPSQVKDPDSSSTEAQHKAIFSLLNKLDVKDDLKRHEKATVLAGIDGETITSMKALSKGQASEVIRALSLEVDAK